MAMLGTFMFQAELKACIVGNYSSWELASCQNLEGFLVQFANK